MTNFNYDIEDLNDTSSLVKKSAENFYRGQVKPLKTTDSQNGDNQRTLTQRDIHSVIGGDALYRSPVFGLQISNQNVQSSISQIIAGGSFLPETGPDATNLVIQDPDSEDPNAKLTGQAAFQKIIAKSSLGKGGLSYGVPNYLAQVKAIEENNTEAGDTGEHRDTSEESTFDPTKSGTSEYRLITFKEDLPVEEQAVFEQRIESLKATDVASDKKYTRVLMEARNFDVNKWPKTITSRGINAQELDRSIDYSTFNNKTVFPCASIIECLLYINSKIKVRGEFDLDRGWIYTSGGQGGNLNDHVCGRGIDIFEIGVSEDSMINLRTRDVNKHREALDILLKVLKDMPQNIHPDLLVVHDELADDYGMIREGFDIDVNGGPQGGILQKQYQMLKNINFHPDSGHRDHFHLAFSPYRAGNYKDWVQNQLINDMDLSEAIESIPGFFSDSPILQSEVQQLFTGYYPGVTFLGNLDILYRALIQYGGFSPEVSAIFMMLAERESNFQPGAFASDSDDYSIGLFQTNYSDTTGAKFINRTVKVSSLNSNGTIRNEEFTLWKLIIKDWQELGINNQQQAFDKIKELRLQGIGRDQMDQRLFQPINQINLLVSYVQDYRTRWKFSNWGEYPNGPEYGWIHKTRFQTAVDFYVRNNPGKTKEDLVRWAKNFPKDNMIIEKSKENFSAWLNGSTFGF